MKRSMSVVVLSGALALIGVEIAGCSSDSGDNGGSNQDGNTGTAKIAGVGAAQVVTHLTQRVPTASPSLTFTAANDPKKLLGRPGEYTSKAAFVDSRILTSAVERQPGGDITLGSVDLGGIVEVFANDEDAKARQQLVRDTVRKLPQLGEYDYLNGKILVRVSRQLTPEEAKEYETALNSH